MKKTEKGIQRRDIPCEAGLRLRQQEGNADAPAVIEGVAIVFNRPSVPLYEDAETVIREVIAPEAVPQSLLDSSDILLTLYHDNDRLLARSLNGKGSLAYEVRDDGVYFSFEPADTPDGRTALEHVRRGDINGCSFAFGVDTSDPAAEERTVRTVNGKREITYTVRSIAFIRDFTLTPRPVYRDTQVGEQKRDEERAREHEAGAEIRTQVEKLRARADIY